MSRRQLVALGVTAASLAAVIAVAWFLQSGGEDEYSVRVVRSGTEVASFDVGRLRALPQSQVEVDGKSESGPSLLEVLSAAGVTSFSSVTVKGMGLRDSGSITFRRTELNPEVLLDFAQRGTVKVVSPTLSWDARVRDVTTIEVR